MVEAELKKLLAQIQSRHCEEQTIEVKSAPWRMPGKIV